MDVAIHPTIPSSVQGPERAMREKRFANFINRTAVRQTKERRCACTLIYAHCFGTVRYVRRKDLNGHRCLSQDSSFADRYSRGEYPTVWDHVSSWSRKGNRGTVVFTSQPYGKVGDFVDHPILVALRVRFGIHVRLSDEAWYHPEAVLIEAWRPSAVARPLCLYEALAADEVDRPEASVFADLLLERGSRDGESTALLLAAMRARSPA